MVILSAICLISFALSSVFMDTYAVISLAVLQCLYADIDICRQEGNSMNNNNSFRPTEM